MDTLTTTDPRTGKTTATDIPVTGDEELQRIIVDAVSSGAALAVWPRSSRAALLDALVEELEADGDRLVSIACAETGLGEGRLRGEIARSCFQFRLFADAVREGSFLEAAIDHAAETPLGAQPDVRRMLVPIGPVAVFGSSNFPFAFSVPGGDTASTLAAGNPVIVKAHSAHPLTSRASFEALRRGAERAGAPRGTIGIVYGQEAGTRLVAHPEIRAVGFTGSLGAAERLMTVIRGRDQPIPFYGELQSINPLLISSAALQRRSAEIAAGLAASVTGSAGQLCTKPGVALVPEGAEAEAFVEELVAAMRASDRGVLLNRRVLSSFRDAEREIAAAPGVLSLLDGDEEPEDGGFVAAPRVLRVAAAAMTAEHAVEAFGPLVLVVTYADDAELLRALETVPGSLTVSVHAEGEDAPWVSRLLPRLVQIAGRLVYNGYPTGVRVSWAQHHGGPWPATNTIHTSVGVMAMRRFLRPFAWQNTPQELLPDELRDDCREVPRRVDGELRLPR